MKRSEAKVLFSEFLKHHGVKKEFVQEYCKQRRNGRTLIHFMSYVDIGCLLNSAFVFHATSQGHRFWQDLSYKWDELIYNV